MKDFYAAVLKSGQFVELSSIDEFKNIIPQTVECYLSAKEITTNNNAARYWCSIIDKEGQPCSYKVGCYEVTFLGKDTGTFSTFGREITIHNCLMDSYYKYYSKCWYTRFILEEVKPLLEKLNQCETEEEVRKTLSSHISYADLEYELSLLTDRYNSLKEESDKMGPVIEKLTSVLDEIRNALSKLDAETDIA